MLYIHFILYYSAVYNLVGMAFFYCPFKLGTHFMDFSLFYNCHINDLGL
jgi:hypothetical protein